MKNLWIVLLLTTCLFAQPTGIKPILGTQLDWGHPLTKELVGAWFNQEAAPALGTLYDLSGNRNHGTLGLDTRSVAGRFGPALDFDGTGDSVLTPVIIPVSGTIIIWHQYGFDTGSTATKSYYVCAGTTADNELTMQWQSGQTRVIPYTNNDFIGLYSPGTLTGWHQFAITYDSSAGLFYHNGELKLSEFTDHTTGGTVPLIIGNRDVASSVGFLGQIDSVLLYNRALTASEIASLYVNPFQMFRQERLPIASAGAPPEVGQLIMVSSIPFILVLLFVSLRIVEGKQHDEEVDEQ